MQIFICCLVALAAFASVSCNTNQTELEADQLALRMKLLPVYGKMTVPEMKTFIATKVKEFDALLTDGVVRYEKEDLQLMAKVYKNVIAFVNEGLKVAYETLDKVEDATFRKALYVYFGVSFEETKFRAETEGKDRIAYHLNITDTEAEAQKKYSEVADKLTVLTKWSVEDLGKKNKTFWAELHQYCYDYMVGGFKQFEIDVKKLTTSETRAKNLGYMARDLDVLYSIKTAGKHLVDVKAKSPFEKFIAKIKAFFAKIF